MTYNIVKITISRHRDDSPWQDYSWDCDVKTNDLKAERESLKKQYQAEKVFFSYVEIPKI